MRVERIRLDLESNQPTYVKLLKRIVSAWSLPALVAHLTGLVLFAVGIFVIQPEPMRLSVAGVGLVLLMAGWVLKIALGKPKQSSK